MLTRSWHGHSSIRQRTTLLSAITLRPKLEAPSDKAFDRRRIGRDAARKEVRRSTKTIGDGAGAVEHPLGHPARVDARTVESIRTTLRRLAFTSKRFHVLLNSLFKVLFNFPSRYLLAIGLVQVFSLRWSLPPALGCILKQPDSEVDRGDGDRRLQRPDTRHG